MKLLKSKYVTLFVFLVVASLVLMLTACSESTDIGDTPANVTSRFVAVGDDGLGWWSPDGKSWTASDPGGTDALRGIAYGGDRFVTVGSNGAAFWSEDGKAGNWTDSGPVTAERLRAIAYGNSTFITVGNAVTLSGVGEVWWSPDGVSWTASTTLPAAEEDLYSVAFGNNIFIAAGNSAVGNTLVWRSADNGVTWSSASLSGTTEFCVRGITYNGTDRFVAVGFQDLTPDIAKVWTSVDDGLNWTEITPAGLGALYAVAYGSGNFVAVGTAGLAAYSTDNGATWNDSSPGSTASIRDITYWNGTFVAVGDDAQVWWSVDGTSWTDSSPNPGSTLDLNAIACNDGP